MNNCISFPVPVVGRCIPKFISQIISGASDLLTDNNNTVIVDKYGSAVNGTVLEESTKWVTCATASVNIHDCMHMHAQHVHISNFIQNIWRPQETFNRRVNVCVLWPALFQVNLKGYEAKCLGLYRNNIHQNSAVEMIWFLCLLLTIL